MAREWTNEQQLAIYSKWRDAEKTKSSNILVNAAAGSGKTAVLVERIINKLCADVNSKDRCDVDGLLVVTFTNAAAKEMQQRISDALQKKYNDALDKNDTLNAQHLKKQLSLIHSADITTIDAFCLKTVRNYFHLLGIDPSFSIIDKPQSDMMKDEAIEELYEKYYADDELITLLSLYSEPGDESGLTELILKIYDFTRSVPNPNKWLFDKLKMIKNCDLENPWFETIKSNVYNELKSACDLLLDGIRQMICCITSKSESMTEQEIISWIDKFPPEKENDLYLSFGNYYKAMYDEYILFSSLIGKDLNQLVGGISDYSFLRLSVSSKFKNKEKEIKDKEILESLKQLRDEAKSIIQKSVKPALSMCNEENIDVLKNEVYPSLESLVNFVIKFDEIYSAKKLSKSAYEFSDIEHKCLELFLNFPEVCEELKGKYTEILMDEYQDSNSLQEEIFKQISRGDNVFMVGDMKQSIYRFRNSDPTIFKSKSDTYQKNPLSRDRKIVLSKNFRSRREVLFAINSVFSAVMSEETGGIEYDEDQCLNFGDTKYEDFECNIQNGYKAECYAILNKNSAAEDDELLANVEAEARFVAKKIFELKKSGFLVRDKKIVREYDENGEIIVREKLYQRPVQNRDIAIIMSSCKGVSKAFANELAALGIDSFTHTGGYFDRIEVQMALSLLKLINNPYNDVPLISVMRSHAFGFTDDELCIIRRYSKSAFYDAVKNASVLCKNGNEINEISDKCHNFMLKLEKWRNYSKFMPCDKLIWTLYEETGLYAFCEAVYGSEAGDNLRLLFSRAKRYEASGYRGIFNFIRYIDKLKKKEEDLSSAVIMGEESDVVRIMTIHKSKGLEFPIVFAARTGAKFNMSDTKGHLLLDKELGFGPDYINYNQSYFTKTIANLAIEKKIKQDSISEEMRKLYVLLTRAKEKLIVTSVCDGLDDSPKNMSKWISSYDKHTRIVKKNICADAMRFIDWIAPVAVNDSENWSFNTVKYSDAVKYEVIWDTDEQKNGGQYPIVEVTDGEYRHIDAVGMSVKLSVSQLKNKNSLSDCADLVPAPQFLSEEGTLTGAQRGTAIHYVMQKFIPFEDMKIDDVKEFINKLYVLEELTKAEADSVNPEIIMDFYNSELGKRILKSPRVLREVPFEMEIPASDVYDIESSEKIMLQGIIDCCFFEGDDVIIVDYKSDYYNDIVEIKQKYSIQLDYYGKAVEKILNKRVKSKFIYLFSTESVLQC